MSGSIATLRPTCFIAVSARAPAIDAQDFKLPIGRKYFINVGSVGQPRDGDPRAAYVLYSPKERTVRFRRLDYDIAAAQAKIRAAGLPERLAQRLALGQ